MQLRKESLKNQACRDLLSSDIDMISLDLIRLGENLLENSQQDSAEMATSQSSGLTSLVRLLRPISNVVL